jgi:hypothetical protein
MDTLQEIVRKHDELIAEIDARLAQEVKFAYETDEAFWQAEKEAEKEFRAQCKFEYCKDCGREVKQGELSMDGKCLTCELTHWGNY